jgi:hypothetical protein
MNNNSTVKIIVGLSLLLSCVFSNAQTGLQNIIVEKYYVSDANDSIGSAGILPVGSVTYRIFADMKAGYKFQAAYGTVAPAHTLFIKTTTSFFNNEDRGATSPTYTKSQAKNNTVMLDSWLTAGAACTGNFGILKSEDDGVGTVVNADNLLQNNDIAAGIPLTEQDGLLAGTPGNFTKIGLDPAIDVFDALSQVGNSFVVDDGAWSCLEGAMGPDTTNKVLIGQITTDGDLTFELNIQIGTPDGGAEQYVARNPVGLETQLPSLIYNSIFAGTEKPIEKTRNADIVSVFPNPTTGAFSLRIKSENNNPDYQYTIYDLVGNAILKRKIENTSADFTDKIDMSAYPDGMYFIEVLTAGNKTIRKLVKN